MKNFGVRLKEAREIRKLTQRELAIMCDTDEAIIRSYEKGRRAPSKSMMLRLFNALKTPPDFFFQDELSFNPYEANTELGSVVGMLSPASLILLRDFLRSLQTQ